jgi:hypothetical protein
MKRVPTSHRGFAMVLALFLVLVLYTGITVMMANFRAESAMSQQAFELTQYRFAAQGAVNKLYTLLRNGSSPDDYPRERPLKVQIGDFGEVSAWVVEGETPGVFHLLSTWQGVGYSKVIAQQISGGARVYSNDGGTLVAAAPDDTTWSALPSPPPRALDSLTGLEVDCSDLKLSSRYFRANDSGQVAGVYEGTGGRAIYLWDEGTQAWSMVPPAPGWRAVGGDIEPGGPPDIRSYVALGEKTLFTYDNITEFGAPKSVVSYFDLETKTWQDLRGPFNGARVSEGYVGPDDTFVVEVEYGGRTRALQLVDGAWNELPALPNGASLGKIRSDGPDGVLYASSTDGNLHKFESGQWSQVDVPPSVGNLQSVDAEGALLFWSTDLKKLHRWDQTSDPKEMPQLASFQGAAGGGTKEETVSEGYQATASY